MAEKNSKKTKPDSIVKSRAQDKKDFLIVGLGASAGGVKALQEFFATMPPASGMAFVVVLHLDPHHESKLGEILQAQTAMQVVQVNAPIKVEPNRVYIAPPKVQLEMRDGVIRPARAERTQGHHVAIDVFFRTLAEAYEKNAVCIVLSGTGSDGTLGLKRIKESNGFAIVQSPEDAEFDSMPLSAINTQLADWVLPVREMPEKLIHFKKSSERLHLTNGADADKIAKEIQADESLREILTLLRVRTGHDFSNYKTPTLVRRIARHLQIHELEDIPSYLELLRQKPEEIQSLLKNLLINVTNFFRDKDAFEALEEQVIPKIFEGKTSRDTVRVWSCGCASGEEAYSLAMLLSERAERLNDPPKFQVFASDVDDDAITEARAHRYPASIETDVSEERLKRFFVKEGSHYSIKKVLREAVLFAPHNVLRDPPFSKLDLISCRNLLIYLNRETQERVLQIFHFALNHGGFLFLGNSESAESLTNHFSPIDKKQRLYARRYAPTAQTGLPMMPVAGRWEVKLPDKRTETARDRAATLSEIHHKLLENYAPSSVLVDQNFDIVYLSGAANRFLRFSGGEPSRNLLKAVLPDLLPDLRAALFSAQREHKSSEFPSVRVNIEGEETLINLIVRAVETADETNDYLLVIFEEKNSPEIVKKADREIEKIAAKDEAMEAVVRRLEEDLQRTKELLRFTIEQHETTIEEYKASNEEAQAINEELRSSSEELETSKEELQSVNEELTTVNHELKDKIDETSRINSDLQNLMAATDIATIFLDKNLRIKRYTPPVEEIFNITASDIGRPLEHFTHRLDYQNLAADAGKVLRNLKTVEREIADRDGNFFLARFAPYRTIDDRINGVVLNFIDISERRRMEDTLRRSEEKYRTLFDSIDEGYMLCEVIFDASDKPVDIFYIEANPAAIRLAGRDFTGQRMREIAPDYEEYWYEIIGRVALTGETVRAEHYAEPHGRWFDFIASKVGGRESRRVASVFQDITERKLRERQQEFLLKLSDDMRPLADAVEIQEAVAQASLNYFGADRCYYCEIEDGNAVIRRDASRGGLPSVVGVYPLENLPLFKVSMETGRPFVVEDVNVADSMDKELRRLCIQMQIISFINVPVIKNNQYAGNFCITRSAPRRWSEFELDSAQEIAERTWAAVERARAEEALRRSEGRLRALFESIDVGFSEMQVVLDEEGHVVDWLHLALNGNFSRVTGIPDITGRLASEVFPNLEGEWFRRMDLAYRTGEPQRFEAELAELGRWFDNYITRLGGEDDKRVFGVFGDITERKRRERQQEFLLKFSDALRTLPDKETIEETGLRLLAEFLRLDRAYVFVLYPPEDRAVVRAEQRKENLASLLGEVRMSDFPETVRQIEDQTLVFNDIDSDARLSDLNRTSLAAANLQAFVCTSVREGERNVIWSLAAASATPRTWTKDEVELIETVGERIWAAAERARAEEALRESEMRRHLALDATEMGTFLYHPQEDRGEPDERMLAIFGLKAGDTLNLGEALDKMIHPGDREYYQKEVAKATDPNGDGKLYAEFRVIHPDESVHWIAVTAQTVFDGKPPLAVQMYGTAADITERKQAEEALRESKTRLQSIANLVPDLLWDSEPDGSTNWYNNRWLEYTGQSFEEAIGWGWIDAVHPDDREASARRSREAVENGEMLRQEHRIRRYDGEYRWFVINGYPLKDKSGKVVKIYGAATDIHESRLMHEVVRESEEKYRTLFDSIDEGFCTIEVLFDKKGKAVDYRFLEANPAFVRQTGIENGIGKTMREIAPEHEEFWFETYGRVAKTGEPVRFEHEAAAFTPPRFYDVYAFRIGQPEENRVAIIFNDILLRKQAEEALLRSEEHFRAIVNQNLAGIFEIDLGGRVIFANDEFCRMLGYECDALSDVPMEKFIHPEDLTESIKKLARMQKSKKPFETEKRFVRQDGSVIWVHNSVSPIMNGDKNIHSAVIVSVDMTERKIAEESLRESEKRLRLATEAAEMYSWEYDVRSGTYNFSENAWRVLGIAKRNLPRTVEETFALVHPDDKRLIEKSLKRAVHSGEGFALDFRTVTSRGKIVWLAVQSVIVMDEHGKPARVVGIAQNISARKTAEQALRESEERTRIAVEAGELATWEWDIENERVIWNERHFTLFGMKPLKKPMKPEDFFYHVHPDDRDLVSERLDRALEKKIPFEAEFRAVLETGAVRWMNGYGRVTETDKSGKATRMSGVMFDIDERKQSEIALRKSEEQLQLILESTREYAIITFDLNGCITRWNTGAERIFGYTEKEAVGRFSAILFTPEDQAKKLPELELKLALEKGRAQDERWHVRKDGSRFFASGVMQPLKDGKTEGFVKIARDQTAQLEADNARREKEMLQRLIAGQEEERRRIARDIHDHFGQQVTALRLKLRSLKKFSEIESISGGIDEAYEIVKKLDTEVDFLAWELRPAVLDDLGLRLALAEYIKEWSNSMGIKAEFHSLGMSRGRLNHEIEINLYRVAQEALNNVYKHAKAKTVSVLLEKRQNTVNLIIEDDGIGFDPEDRKIKSKGLGLIGMTERIALIGGEIKIESTPKQGTTIFVRVPLKNKKEKS